MGRIADFFEGRGRDSEGRTLDDILAWDDDALEDVHDYIQWLFPLREPSRFNPDAPLLDDAEIALVRARPDLQARQRAALERMLRFYGLRFDGRAIVRADNWARRSAEWVQPLDHNFLRLTRILTSLRLLGLDQESDALFAALDGVAREHREAVGNSAYYWREAQQSAG